MTIGIVTVLWVLFGFSLTFGTENADGFIGDFSELGLSDMLDSSPSTAASYPIPILVFAAFQLMFAIITPALITGAIADRAKFAAGCCSSRCGSTLVYFPVAHWVFAFGDADGNGRLARQAGACSTSPAVRRSTSTPAPPVSLWRSCSAGGSAGRSDPMRPHSLPLVMLGAGLLWFGWFGFNAGSALGANGVAAVAFMNTQIATAAAMLGWLLVERIRDGHATTLGAASGAVAGLVAITPSCAASRRWARSSSASSPVRSVRSPSG